MRGTHVSLRAKYINGTTISHCARAGCSGQIFFKLPSRGPDTELVIFFENASAADFQRIKKIAETVTIRAQEETF